MSAECSKISKPQRIPTNKISEAIDWQRAEEVINQRQSGPRRIDREHPQRRRCGVANGCCKIVRQKPLVPWMVS